MSHGSPTTANATAAERRSRPRSCESTINQVISKRMVRKQQMRWSLAGAQLCKPVQVLNSDLTADFRRWYPGFTHQGPGRARGINRSRALRGGEDLGFIYSKRTQLVPMPKIDGA